MRIKRIKDQKGISEGKARLVARLKADGSVFKSDTDYVVSYDTSEIEEAKRLSSDIKEVYGLKTKMLRHRSGFKPNRDVQGVRSLKTNVR